MNASLMNTRRCLTFLLVSCAISLQVKAQQWSGGDIGNTQNWSDGANWAGGIAPTSSGAVVFPDGAFPVTTNAQGVVNNIVQSSTTIASLTYDNGVGHFDTTLIPASVILTVNGNLTVGPGTVATVATVTGAGTLNSGSGASTLQVTSSSGTPFLDLSTLNTFTFNAGGSGGTVNVSTSAGGGGKLNLASLSNYVTAGTLNIANNNTANTGVLNLGNGTNILNVDTINMGISKGIGTMQFLNNAGGGLKIANHTGTGRTTLTISGEGSTGGTSTVNTGNILLNGGTVNILGGTLTLANRTSRSEASALGVLQFNNGTVDITTINMSLNTSGGTAPNATISDGGGTLIIGSGGMSMVNNGGAAGTGTLIATNGATVICSNNIYKTTANGVATITLSNASLTMTSIGGTIGVSNSSPIDNFSITNSTLTLPAVGGPGSPDVAVVNLNADASTQNTINITAMPTITLFPSQFPIISYQAASGNLNTFVLGTLPGLPGTFSGYISNNTTSLSIDLVVTNGPVAKADTWSGAVNTLWDTTTSNWLSSGTFTNYNDLDQVTFDDTASNCTVSIVGARTPATVNGLTFNNSSSNYTFNGTGKISGGVGLVKNDAASVTLSETGGDNFTGGINVTGGTLVLDDASSAITGGLTIGSGTTVQIGNNDGVGVLPGGSLDDEGTLVFDRTNNLSVGTAIPGGGALVQSGRGTLTLTAANTYSGSTTVSNGTLALSGGGSIIDSTNVVVTNATLDVSAVTTSATLTAVDLSNAVVNVKVGYQQTNFTVSSLTLSGSNAINVHSLPPIAFYPATNVLVQSGSAIVGNNFTLGSLPTATPAYVGTVSLSSDQTQVLLVLTAGPIGLRPTVTWSGVDALGAVSTNWSDAQNWQTPGTPVIGEKVVFNNNAAAGGNVFNGPGQGPGGITSPGNINNIVDINSTNAGLNYANAGNFHNTQINPGKTLIVNGAFTVNGSGGTTTVLGTNAALTINNPANSSTLDVENGTAPTLDLSGLDTFTATVSQIGVGYDIASSASASQGILYLARTNIITTGNGFSGLNASLVVGGVNSQNTTGAGTLYLGQSNALFVDGIVLGVGQDLTPSSVTFNPNFSNNPVAYIRGVSGNSSRVTQWSLGDDTVNLNNNASGFGHVVDFTGGTLNAMVGTLIVGQGAQGNEFNTNVMGTFNVGSGNLDVTTLSIGIGDSGKTGGTGIGIMNVTGGTVVANAVNLGVTAPTNTQGTLNLTNATLVLSNGVTIGTGTAGGTLSVIGSTVDLLNAGTIGSSTAPLTTLNLDGGTLQLIANASAGTADIDAGTVDATNLTTINLTSVTNVSGSAQIPLISYTNSAVDPYTNLVLGTVPAGYTVGNGGALVDNTGNLSIDVILNVVSTSPTTNANITHVFLSGTNLIIQGTNNNVPNTNFHYAVLVSTNVALPLSNWTILSTNPFNSDGTFDYTNPVVPGTPHQFIDVQAVP